MQRIFEAIWRIQNRTRYYVQLAAAFLWRRLMFRTTVIAVTGSVGKTTAKECLAAIMTARGPTHKTRNNENDMYGVPPTILAMRPWHRYAVIEIGTGSKGQVTQLGRLVKPDVAVILSVARTHTNVFQTLEDTAFEKAQLVKCLPRRGIVVLNGDDLRVREMAKHCHTKVVFFGRSSRFDVHAKAVKSTWPERLTLEVHSGNESVSVSTRLVGAHWTNSVLGALSAAQQCGVPLRESVCAISEVAPFTGRMQPVILPNGATVVRDEMNGSPDTLEAMLTVLRESQARRRVLVISDFSDSRERPQKRQRMLGKTAAEHADIALFTGRWGRHALRGAVQAGMNPDNCHAVSDLRQAADLLTSVLRCGDLVFLKGRTTDHLTRILWAQFGRIGCWKSRCQILRICDVCKQLQPEFDLNEALMRKV